MDNILLTDYVNDIPFIFFSIQEQMRSAILVESNISVKVGDRIVEVLIDANGYVVSGIGIYKAWIFGT
uniref:Uncharacterized protein n=1 Tax=Panagrolaimus sp. PS1159 TaxID=55785 RepID=A0AC35FRW4_9BILA